MTLEEEKKKEEEKEKKKKKKKLLVSHRCRFTMYQIMLLNSKSCYLIPFTDSIQKFTGSEPRSCFFGCVCTGVTDCPNSIDSNRISQNKEHDLD